MLTYGLLIFAAAFLVVAIVRVVEFKAAGISDRQRLWLVPLHLLGSGGFAAAIAIMALDVHREHAVLLMYFFFGSTVVLFPTQIYLAIKRKIRMSK